MHRVSSAIPTQTLAGQRYQGLGIAPLFAAAWLAVSAVNPANAQGVLDLTMSGRGHGILFDGVAREQAGVPDGVAEAIWNMQDQLTAWRSHIHMNPEVSDKEEMTKAYVMDELKAMGYDPKPLGPTTGVIVDVKGKDDSFTIGIRADMDALPIQEVDDGRVYRSKIDGVMHACGHDAHTTVGLGIAKAFADGMMEPPVNLRFIFQPAEETGTGAVGMVEAGVLDGVDVIIGLHSDPSREWGRIGIAPVTWSAFANGYTIEIEGVASHGGMAPEKGRDAIVAGSYVVAQLQTIVSRNVAPQNAATVSVGTFNGGRVMNQIADKVMMAGTMRAQTQEIYDTIVQRAEEIVEGASKSFDMEMKFAVNAEMPGTVINSTMFNLFHEVSQTVVGPENVDVFTTANMGGEDFAYFSTRVPAMYYWLGIANNEEGINSTLHTIDFDIDHKALPVGVALQLAQIAKIAEHHAAGGEF